MLGLGIVGLGRTHWALGFKEVVLLNTKFSKTKMCAYKCLKHAGFIIYEQTVFINRHLNSDSVQNQIGGHQGQTIPGESAVQYGKLKH